ncbi:cytosine/adenosine deaminase [Synechococcus sp. PCC 7502]|uniref:tRNA adenosine(34) deaminase TadA n=1 Tax=Synechococcus sp. PCC 7502 TaxID=1173263 RepID=UPI00029FD6ED|nr:tRNA adenosine(34) deaminase TadA [Synechococcus sp. PCC 7502]AFY73771.1 cytosine/adenosine deaminase [Synechococcus sp. PCC 7502]
MNPSVEIDFESHRFWMDQAIALAKQAGSQGEIPVAAVIIGSDQKILATGENRKERDRDPTAHAEILAIRNATKVLKDWHLNQATLYVTLEPCPMCAGAIIQARVKTLVYGASDHKTGAIHTVLNLPHSSASFHKLQAIAGIRELECQSLLQTWFQKRRQD